MLFQDLVRKFGAGFECQFFRENQRVVAVEEEFFDLGGGVSTAFPRVISPGGGSFIHLRHLEL